MEKTAPSIRSAKIHIRNDNAFVGSLLLTIQVSMKQGLNIQALPNNNLYVFKARGLTKLLDFNYKSYFNINTTQLQLTIIQAKNNLKLLKVPANEIPSTN